MKLNYLCLECPYVDRIPFPKSLKHPFTHYFGVMHIFLGTLPLSIGVSTYKGLKEIISI